MATAAAPRRAKWQQHHPPPPPTPRILHFPRRPRRRTPSKANNVRLGTLLDREREMRACVPPTPIVVFDQWQHCDETTSRRRSSVLEEEDKWKFQAEMLRAECNLLRMEKEIALNKLHRARAKMETTLRSALRTLVSGRIKICEGRNIEMVLDEEIRELTEKLERLQKRSAVKDVGVRSQKNFDKQVSVLQRRLEKIGGSSDEIRLREFQEENISLSIERSSRFHDCVVASGKLNVEILRRKMEGLSKGMLLQRMEEEYNSLLSTASGSLTSSGSTSKRVEFQDSSSSKRPPHQEKLPEGNLCAGHCKTIVRRIVEQVRAESEQWSQMQEMLGQVREEMEELQASRDFWEDRAKHADSQIQSLNNAVQEWRHKALSYESKTNEIEAKLCVFRGDLERLRKEQNDAEGSKCSAIPHNELEKRIVVCCSKENNNCKENSKHNNDVLRKVERKSHVGRGGGLRSPFGDIGNSLLMKQNGKAVFPLHCHLSSNGDKK
ncbi:hypothetical protein RJT34_31639 [Clitoria ternatea]|uniref:Uncharacterized protein n=1 Tax=Clitoria ternatea TaxID=43366 RepID=A0AAN9I316_CLITE